MARPIVLTIPTLDEAESIGEVLADVPRDLVGHVFVADGGSSDATCAIAERAGAHVIHAGRGYGRACLASAQQAPADAIMVFMDGDGADDPTQIPELVAPIANGTHDFVIGSRVKGVREAGSMGWHQIIAGLGAGLATQVLYRTRYTDMCAFRAIGRDTLLALGMCEMTYGWNLEMQMRVAQRGLRVCEVPVRHRRRIGGTSKVAGTLRGTVRAGTRIMATFVRVAREEPARRAVKV